MTVNRISMIGVMVSGAFSVLTSDSVIEGVMTALIAVPIMLSGAVFYRIFTSLHRQTRTSAS
ncbi:MAG: hypothetical protein WCT28_00190 [Patescibacteria group bacterium]